MIYNIDYKYFDKARQAALISDFRKIHIGCIAVYQGTVIGIGCNCNKTHPIQKNIINIENHLINYCQNYMLK